MNILLVGCGKMGGALLTRWQGIDLFGDILVIDPQAENALKAREDVPLDFVPDIVVFAVKPQALAEITPAYRVFDKAVFISIAAGKTTGFFERHLGVAAKIVRCMPNTPAAIGRGITVACANKNVSADEKSTAQKLLGAVGEVLWVDDESKLDAVTALSGSGPAYVFLLIEILAKAGINAGLAPDMAEKLARATVTGSAALAEAEAGTPASKLRENVTSPKGTTEAALSVLMDGALQEIYDRAISAATTRAAELAE
jgi:pyrroline-5-carboxylate reductase